MKSVRKTSEVKLEGTSFQKKVWRELLKIPYGETRTYKQIAEKIRSHPRAVARAIASNKLAVIIPCHRVVRSDGSLGGYRWGINRKKRLLEQESSVSTTF